MYSNAIILKDLTLKIVRGAFMYHEVTAYDRIIAYARLSFLVIDMKRWLIILMLENSGMQKGTLISWVIHYTLASVLYSNLLDRILRS